jgi:hypothetical protein
MTKVIWKLIPDYPNYMISNKGDVKTLNYKKSKKERELKQRINNRGYYCLTIWKNNKPKMCVVHVFMAKIFLNYVPLGRKYVVDHINNIKTDNKLENLQVITQRENTSKDKDFNTKASKYIGVCWDKRNKKWKATIRVNKKRIFLGYFYNEQEASNYYQNAILAIENSTEIKKLEIPTSSKHIGVSYDKKQKKWKSYFYKNCKMIYIGMFKTEQEAVHARHIKLLTTSELTAKISCLVLLEKLKSTFM